MRFSFRATPAGRARPAPDAWRIIHGLAAPSIAVAIAACAASGQSDLKPGGSSGADGGPGNAPNGGPGSAPATAADGSPTGTTAPAFLPVRIRRLTNAEWATSAQALVHATSKTAAQFTPDVKQGKGDPFYATFTVNTEQIVSSVLAGQIDTAAHELASAANVTQLAPCAAPTTGGEACAKAFIASFATAAYRRPSTDDENTGLLAVYHAAADGGAYADGIQAVIAAVLESPGFIYLTEIGDGTSGNVSLTDYEIASQLSYLLTGGPPDAALLSAAQSGSLHDGMTRQQQARRLLKTDGAKTQLTQVIEQWLGIDGVASTAKDTNTYPQYSNLRQHMSDEADAFISEVVWKEGKGVADLFGASWTIAGSDMARFYGAGAPDSTGRVSLAGTGRTGILDQAAFLATYASATASAPILRGVAVLRRVACVDVEAPARLKIVVVPPPPDPTKTTRQLFTQHVSAQCAYCHNDIDAVGFAFENFDGEGQSRTTEAMQPIDTTTTVAQGLMDLGGSYHDSAQLAAKIANSTDVRTCFARYMFRYAAAQGATQTGADATDAERAEQAAEASFVSVWQGLPAASQDSLIEVLVAYAGSPGFITRQVVP